MFIHLAFRPDTIQQLGQAFIKKNQILLYSLNTFWVSRVSGAHLHRFAPGPMQQWRVVGNVWEI